jgi:hypothetical protein
LEETMNATTGTWSVVNAAGEAIAENLCCWEDALDVVQKTFDAKNTDWRRPRGFIQSFAEFEFFDLRTDKVLALAFCDYE